MDSKQFDELVARLASGQSRRNAVKGIVGGALVTAGVSSAAEVEAKKKNKKNKKNKKCKLKPGETRCSKKKCVDLKTDPQNCGSCGFVCPSNRPICRR